MKEDDEKITRIIGNERLTNESFRQGRLHFVPSFFDKVDYEIVNPHDRKTRTGTVPILIESIPSGSNSKFSLLYVPFDLAGKEKEESAKQMLEDLKVIAKGIEAMFTVYGFGAKTSSGYGIAKINDGFISINAKDNKVKIEPELPKSFSLNEAKTNLRSTLKNHLNSSPERGFIEKRFDTLMSFKESVGKAIEVLI